MLQIELVGLLDFHHVQLHPQARLLRHLHMAAHDLQGVFGQALAVLPDPVGVDGRDAARCGGAHMGEHGQGHIKVVVGVRAPGQAPVAAGLRHAHRAGHGPEVRVGQRNIHALQRQRVGELPPVGGNHVGGRGQAGGAAELGHHLAAAEPFFCTAGVFGIGHHAAHFLAQANGVFEQPAAVGVERDAGLGEALVQRHHGFHFLIAAQHAALELEIVEAIALARCLGQAHDGLCRHGLFVAQAEPVVAGARVGGVRQVGLFAVANVEEVAQHLHGIALLAFAQQCGHGHIQVLAQQVEQGRFHRRHGMDGRAQVKGLQAPATGIPVSKLLLHALQHPLVGANGLAHHQLAGVFQRLANLFAAGHLAHPGVAGAVLEHNQIAGEERRVGTAQVHQHAVAARHGNGAQFGHNGGGRRGHGQSEE